MKKHDLFRMCLQNLFRKKARTFLTSLGVVVGCCSVVIMISMGVGMTAMQNEWLLQMGDLNIINVSVPRNATVKLNKKTIETIKNIVGVEIAAPKLSSDGIQLKVYAGVDKRYISENIPIMGMDEKAVEGLNYKLKDGKYFNSAKSEVLVGEFFAYEFADSMRPEGMNIINRYAMYDESYDYSKGPPPPPEPYFNPIKVPIFIEAIITVGNNKTKVTRELDISGTCKEEYNKGWETSQGIIMDLEMLQEILDEINRISGVMKPPNEYANLIVKVTDLEMVSDVETQIKSLGLATESMEDMRKSMEEQSKQIQMLLGGIGAISLFVAAIGITNTMVMSISERTKEIGIMKSLGCFLKDIKYLFLMEAGCIGLIGGITGIILSELASLAINAISGQKLSVIPLWLVLFSLCFSCGIGLISGYYPAKKAVKIPALEAIKHD